MITEFVTLNSFVYLFVLILSTFNIFKYLKFFQILKVQFYSLRKLQNLNLSKLYIISEKGMDSESGEISRNDSEFSVDLKTNKIKKKNKKKKAPSKKPPRITSSSYKKEKCTHYNKGNCAKGDLCTFSHDFEPESAKTICKYFLSNACRKGENCAFSHNLKQYPCRFYHLENKCNLNDQDCRFSHSRLDRGEKMTDFLNDNKAMVESMVGSQKLNLIKNRELKKEIVAMINLWEQENLLQANSQPSGFLIPKQDDKFEQNQLIIENEPLRAQGQTCAQEVPNSIDPRRRIQRKQPIDRGIAGKPPCTPLKSEQYSLPSWVIQKKQGLVHPSGGGQGSNRAAISRFLYSFY